MSHDDDETAIAAVMATELLTKIDSPMEVAFNPVTVFQLTGLVQLACRHPEITPELRATAARFIGAVREYFVDCPTILDVVRKGDDPSQDRPFRR